MFFGTSHHLNITVFLSEMTCAQRCVFSLCVQVGLYDGLERQVSLAQIVSDDGSVVTWAVHGFRCVGLSCGLSSASSVFPTLSRLQISEKSGPFVPPQRTFHKLLPFLWMTVPHGLQGTTHLPGQPCVTSSVRPGCYSGLEVRWTRLLVGPTIASINFCNYIRNTFFTFFCSLLINVCIFLLIIRNYFLLILCLYDTTQCLEYKWKSNKNLLNG